MYMYLKRSTEPSILVYKYIQSCSVLCSEISCTCGSVQVYLTITLDVLGKGSVNIFQYW